MERNERKQDAIYAYDLEIFFLWNIFTLWKCVRRKGKVIAAYQELAVWCKIGGWGERGIGGGGERIGGGRHGKGGGDRIGGGGGGWPPKVNELHCMACLPSFWQMDRMEPFVLPEHTNWTILEVHVLVGIQTLQLTRTRYCFKPGFCSEWWCFLVVLLF